MILKVVKGDSIKESMRAETWNAFIDAANDFKQRAGATPGAVHTPYEIPHNTVMVRNSTGGDLGKNAIVVPTDPLVLPSANEVEFRTRMGWDTRIPETDDWGNFLVLAHPIKDGNIGLAYNSGTVNLRVDVTDDDIFYADVVNGETGFLRSAYNGTAHIVWKENLPDPGERWAIVRLGLQRDVNLLGKTQATVNPGGTGNVIVYFEGGSTGNVINNVYLTWMHNNEQISADTEVQITWFSYERRWRFTGANCEGGGGGGPVAGQWTSGSGQPMTWGDGSPATFTTA